MMYPLTPWYEFLLALQMDAHNPYFDIRPVFLAALGSSIVHEDDTRGGLCSAVSTHELNGVPYSYPLFGVLSWVPTSLDEICRYTGLSRRTVVKHVKTALRYNMLSITNNRPLQVVFQPDWRKWSVPVPNKIECMMDSFEYLPVYELQVVDGHPFAWFKGWVKNSAHTPEASPASSPDPETGDS
jgi:hypothetical protein